MLDAIAKGRYLVIGPGEYHAKAKLTDAKVAEIRAATDAADILAVRYGVVSATIRKVRAGKSWRHVA
jgi:hypothetical protein